MWHFHAGRNFNTLPALGNGEGEKGEGMVLVSRQLNSLRECGVSLEKLAPPHEKDGEAP